MMKHSMIPVKRYVYVQMLPIKIDDGDDDSDDDDSNDDYDVRDDSRPSYRDAQMK